VPQDAAFVTVTPRTQTPAVPAVNVIAGLPGPAVIVPFEIVQRYVAPAPASGTEATRPACPGTAELGAEITAEGALPATVTVADPEEVPAPFTSETAVTV
jgi:hypothetical protein